jgi:dihydrofolate synthase / folylpolyglutamate synthase
MSTREAHELAEPSPAPDASVGTVRWSEGQAEAHLRSLELFGMRFGLQRMHALMRELGSPERSFDAIQVLGTNGKSSTARMIAAILERAGLRTATYTSPHLISYRERVELREREIEGADFAAAIERAAGAGARVAEALGGDERVTQFEALTGAALWAIARARTDVAVIEAGLGGRHDATSVIAPRLTVLTNIALEHTRWLGSTIAQIAEEKLAALPRGGTLALGARLERDARAVADRVAGERGASVIVADLERELPPLRAKGDYQRENFALARTAAEAYLRERAHGDFDERALARAVAGAAASTEVEGRLQVVYEDPPTLLDGAHNPAAVDALLRSLPAIVGERPLAVVFGVLDDKDAAAMLARLRASVDAVWLTEPDGARALPTDALVRIAAPIGLPESSAQPNAATALAHARRWAAERGGAVLATGSVYLVGELLAHVRAQSRAERVDGDRTAAVEPRADTTPDGVLA